jgi:hypothetical protein
MSADLAENLKLRSERLSDEQDSLGNTRRLWRGKANGEPRSWKMPASDYRIAREVAGAQGEQGKRLEHVRIRNKKTTAKEVR